ncbi:histidine phosphatase family protein [Desulforhopalus sp. IMCC35007]|uniref:SixA phosphatase family protein n=1 Tax=Desulforhopalus sp. IMCC35007 TaxID=2569543 RepID=UPI0010ADA72D|nr:histidine phosphatase family protein [Desulforhopalus sp. IMCC35007]TKB09042.1 histidine phosphatase family protein [Desulforhopalus sp. IMCC35007]
MDETAGYGGIAGKVMKIQRLFLIRHAKSSWDDSGLDDFSRPLSKRGRKNAPEMGKRLAQLSVIPESILASPAKRAKKTAKYMAEATGYPVAEISFHQGLYMGSIQVHLDLLNKEFAVADTVFLIGHNSTITELSEYLTGISLVNVPTCGIVAIEYPASGGFSTEAGAGKLLFFDFPKNMSSLR